MGVVLGLFWDNVGIVLGSFREHFGITVGLFGIVFFLVGMSLSRQVGMSPEAVAEWSPDGEMLPDAGRVMYRVDVTLDEPVRSSVLCGPCGHVELVAGGKPSSYTCPSCKMLLWDEEE